MTALAQHAPAADAAPGVPFERLLKVEWSKLSDTRAARWLLGLTALFSFLAIAVSVIFPGTFDQTVEQYVGFTGLITALLLPVVAVLHTTSEFNQRSALFTFTQEPNRIKVLAAKVLVSIWLAVLVALVARLAIAAGLGISSLLGRDVVWGSLAPLEMTGWLVLNVLLGSAFAALAQASAPAIVALFLVPTIFSALAGIKAVETIGRWVDTQQTFPHVLDGSMGGHWGQLATSVLVWIVVPLGLGAWRLSRREIK